MWDRLTAHRSGVSTVEWLRIVREHHFAGDVGVPYFGTRARFPFNAAHVRGSASMRVGYSLRARHRSGRWMGSRRYARGAGSMRMKGRAGNNRTTCRIRPKSEK